MKFLSAFMIATLVIAATAQEDFTFEGDRDGWVLGNSGGSHWERQVIDCAAITCEAGDTTGLAMVRDHPFYTGTTPAWSPTLQASAADPVVSIVLYLKMAEEAPVEVRVWKVVDGAYSSLVLSYTEYSIDDWLAVTVTGTVADVSPGDEFQLEIDSFPNVNTNNAVIVGSVSVTGVTAMATGVTAAASTRVTSFDFESGTQGWEIINHNGGTFSWTSHTDGSAAGIPAPGAGSYYMMVQRCDPMTPGIVAIESPPIPAGSYTLTMAFFITGSDDTPADVTLRYKTAEGVYDALPFHSSRSSGVLDNTAWTPLTAAVDSAEDFQIVIEGYLGASANNKLAIDDVVFA